MHCQKWYQYTKNKQLEDIIFYDMERKINNFKCVGSLWVHQLTVAMERVGKYQFQCKWICFVNVKNKRIEYIG